jgi:ABC-type polysaccharide/polyol phosphate transport system ATPase subunit
MSDLDVAIEVANVSRMFKRYHRPRYRIMEAFGVSLPASAYDEFWALRGASLRLKRGDSLGLIGQNGAGKSTLLNIICGRLKPTSGSITVRGNIQALMDMGTGFHPEFTGRENIISALAYQGITGRAARQCLDEIIDFSELVEFIDQPVKTYSSGMYARLAFSTATAISPDILIIDEILGAGDAYFSSKCAERMRKLTKESGATVLFVSHDMAAVQRMCERAIWIDRGQIRMEGPTLDISKSYYADVLAREEARLRAQTTAVVERMRRRDVSNGPATIPSVPPEELPPSGGDVDPGIRDKWDTAEARFVEVSVGGVGHNAPRHVFEMGEDIEFRIVAELRENVPSCWIAVVLLDGFGNRVCLGVHQFESGFEAGRHQIRACFKRPNLRQGEYVVSLELLPYFDYSWQGAVRLPYLCHWDRCIHFKIDEDYHGTIELGLVSLPMTVATELLETETVVFDRAERETSVEPVENAG